MRILEKIRKRIEYHQDQADKYRVVLDMIVSDLEPEITKSATRKLNGALNTHRSTMIRRGKSAPGPRGKMPVHDALLEVLADGPMTLYESLSKIEALRGVPSNYKSVSQAAYGLVKEGKLLGGKLKRGVYGLPDHRKQIAQLEKTIPPPHSLAGRALRK